VTPRKPNPYFDDNRSGDELSARSLRGGVFSIASRGLSVFVQVGSTIILARLLSPEDFGLVSMVAAFTGFIPMLSDLGTRDAAVQRQSITEHEVSALFWLTVAIGTLLGLLLALGSPYIAAYYHEPRLRDIGLASAVGFVVSAASCQHFALLRRAMQFKAIAAIEVGSNLLSSIVSISMALYGAGYWALVAKPVLLATFTLLGVGVSCRWLPGIPTLTQGVKDMVKFGLHITGFTMADYTGRAIDRIAIGKRNGAVSLGYYQQCLFIYENVLGLLALSLHPVAVAGLSKLTDNLTELKRSWSKAVGALAFFAMPTFGMLAVTAEDVVTLVLGDKWQYTAHLVAILSLRGIPHCIERTLGWLHVPAGRGDRWMRWGLVGTSVQIAALFCGLPFGVEGVVIAYVVSMYIVFVPAIVYAGKPLGIGALDLLRAIAAPFTGTMLLCAVGFSLRLTVLAHVNGVIRVATIVVVCGTIYFLVTVFFLKCREPLALVWRMLGDLRKRGRIS
jgi:PST family polysaccharide transporter